MSIKLRFEKGSLATQVILKDEALKPLLEIISQHQSDEALPAALPAVVASSPPRFYGGGPAVPIDNASDIDLVKQWLSTHSPSEVLGQIQWETYPEKILLLGAFQEATTGEAGWRNADIEARFSDARVPGPSNFARDIASAIKIGIIAPVTPRTYKVTKTGWEKLFDAVSDLAKVQNGSSQNT